MDLGILGALTFDAWIELYECDTNLQWELIQSLFNKYNFKEYSFICDAEKKISSPDGVSESIRGRTIKIKCIYS